MVARSLRLSRAMILLLALTFAFTLLATAALARPGNPLSSQAVPDGRSLHQRATPSGGGLAVIAAILCVDSALRFLPVAGAPAPWLLPHPNLVAATLLLAAISWADDHRPLSPTLRLLVHSGAAVLALGAGAAFDESLLGHAAAFLVMVWSINLFNFMDGMDGFAGGMAVIGFTALGLFARGSDHGALALASFVIAAAFGGFTILNFPPARIFLGDVGSAPLGFLAAVISLWGIFEGAYDAAVPLLVFAPFWVDATLTLLRRLLRGERVWQAHRTHAYQRLALAGWGHRRTVLAEYALMLACVAAASFYSSAAAPLRRWILAGATLAFVALVLSVRLVERKKLPR